MDISKVITWEIVFLFVLIFAAIFITIRCIRQHFCNKSCKCYREKHITDIEALSFNRREISTKNKNYFKVIKKYPGIEIMVECNGNY